MITTFFSGNSSTSKRPSVSSRCNSPFFFSPPLLHTTRSFSFPLHHREHGGLLSRLRLQKPQPCSRATDPPLAFPPFVEIWLPLFFPPRWHSDFPLFSENPRSEGSDGIVPIIMKDSIFSPSDVSPLPLPEIGYFLSYHAISNLNNNSNGCCS